MVKPSATSPQNEKRRTMFRITCRRSIFAVALALALSGVGASHAQTVVDIQSHPGSNCEQYSGHGAPIDREPNLIRVLADYVSLICPVVNDMENSMGILSARVWASSGTVCFLSASVPNSFTTYGDVVFSSSRTAVSPTDPVRLGGLGGNRVFGSYAHNVICRVPQNGYVRQYEITEYK